MGEWIDWGHGQGGFHQTYYPPFDRADLTGASFEGAHFENADFLGAENIEDCTFTGATGLVRVVMPSAAGRGRRSGNPVRGPGHPQAGARWCPPEGGDRVLPVVPGQLALFPQPGKETAPTAEQQGNRRQVPLSPVAAAGKKGRHSYRRYIAERESYHFPFADGNDRAGGSVGGSATICLKGGKRSEPVALGGGRAAACVKPPASSGRPLARALRASRFRATVQRRPSTVYGLSSWDDSLMPGRPRGNATLGFSCL